MNQSRISASSTLLPAAAVDVYSRDSETLQAARGLAQDWRFARVRVNVEEGDAESAIAAYQHRRSPQLVIMQTDTIDDSFTAKLEELAQHCEEGTSAIVIGPVNDVYLYRKLIDMGVTDYLVRPVETPVLAEVIAKSLVDQLEVTGSRDQLTVFVDDEHHACVG